VINIFLLISLASASKFDFTYPTTIILNYNGSTSTVNTNHSNSTDFWITTEGNLGDVSDILGSDITNDEGWITSSSDSWSKNYTLYYTKIQVDNNFSLYYLKSIINSMLNGNLTLGKTYSNTNVAGNLSTSKLYANINIAGNITGVSLATVVSMLGGNITTVNNNINLNLTSSKTYSNSIMNGNLTATNNNINLNLSTSKLYSNVNIAGNITGYTKADSNSMISGNLSTSKLYSNTNIVGNLSLTLLANGSRAMTGDLNLGGFNLTNAGNISFGGSNNIYDNDTCIKIKGLTSLLEIC